MFDLVVQRLAPDDDPALWAAALDHITAALDKTPGVRVAVGRCSHWLRPHQSRWTADGGFALPVGYGSGQGGHAPQPLPQFDWSVVLEWNGRGWLAAAHPATKRPDLRVTIPSRTTRHAQAAVHTLWTVAGENERRYYGFRRKGGVWACTAETEWRDHQTGRRQPRRERQVRDDRRRR